MIFGATVFGLAHDGPGDGKFVRMVAADRAPPFNPVLYSLDAFLPVIDFQQERFNTPSGEGVLAAIAELYFPVHVLAGWILITLGLLGITGLVRKR